MRCRTCQPLPVEVARTADLLGRRWVLAILWAAAEAGAVRFNEFKQALETIPPRTLAARLAELEEAGVLERSVLDTRPPRVEYRLTDAGLGFHWSDGSPLAVRGTVYVWCGKWDDGFDVRTLRIQQGSPFAPPWWSIEVRVALADRGRRITFPTLSGRSASMFAGYPRKQ